MNNITITIRVVLFLLIIFVWISAFVLFRKKPEDAMLAGFGCTILLAFIAEHINNYLVRRKK